MNSAVDPATSTVTSSNESSKMSREAIGCIPEVVEGAVPVEEPEHRTRWATVLFGDSQDGSAEQHSTRLQDRGDVPDSDGLMRLRAQ